MNRKSLLELVAAIAATAAVYGCASAPAPSHTSHTADVRQEASGDLSSARNAWAQCIRAAIPRVDNPQTSSDVLSSDAVARAAMKHCSSEYTNVVRALARTLAPACRRDAACTRRSMETAQREATKAATDQVVTARIRAAGAAALQCE